MITALIGAAFTVAACFALGVWVLGLLRVQLSRLERFPLAFVLGAACLHLVIFVLLALKIAYWPVVIGVLLLVLVLLGQGSFSPASEPGNKIPWPTYLFVPYIVITFLHAWAPESSSDGAGYHLGLVARYLRAHGFERITTNMYASLGGGIETLFLPAFIIGRHSAAAMVHFTFAIALALAMIAYGQRIGKLWVGIAAAFLTFASPVVGIDAASAYNDLAVAAVAFSIFYWLEIWDEIKADSLLILIGLLAGYVYAIKYTAFVMLPFAVAFVGWRSRRWRPVLMVTACAIPMVAPWMIKNWIYVQNPIAPFGNAIFRNPNVHISLEQIYGQILRSYNVPNKWMLPVEVTIQGDKTSGIIGPIFLAAPLALLALRQRAGRRILAAAAILFTTYFLNIGTRFLIPCLPFISLAMLLPFGDSPPALAAIMLFHAITSWPAVIPLYDGHSVWTLDRTPPFTEALRIIPQDAALRRASEAYSMARMIEQYVPKGERVLTNGGAHIAYTTRELLVSYEAGFNESLKDTLDSGWSEGLRPNVRHSFHFPPATGRQVRLVETSPETGGTVAHTGAQWGVNELRFYYQGRELPRQHEWRLQAWPNPWDVQFAFDNSLATRWRTWEAAKPGMYVQVDFSAPQVIDEIRVETCSDDSGMPTAVEIDGRRLRNLPSQETVRLTSNIRQAATYELHARGVNYLLLRDSDNGAEDIRDDPESWGLKEVAVGWGSRLYRVTW